MSGLLRFPRRNRVDLARRSAAMISRLKLGPPIRKPPTLAVASALLLIATVASAQRASVFSGNAVQMIIGFKPDSSPSVWGQMVARHIGDHLPGNPTVIARNMPGGGSYVAANYIYSVAPRDGSVIGLITATAALGPLYGDKGARFNATRMAWIGSPTRGTQICIAKSTSSVHSAQDLFTKELIIGDTGAGSQTETIPKALAALLGLKFKLISGFPTSLDVFLAMERGEVDGICESLEGIMHQRPDWIATGKVRVLFQGGAPDPELKGVPSVISLARNSDEAAAIRLLYASQSFGRPFVGPPDLTPDRLKMLQDAFETTMKDPRLLAEAKKERFKVHPTNGANLTALIDQVYSTPKPVVDKVRQLMK